MTKLRALHGALAGAATALAIGATAHAGVANYTIDAGSSQSEVDNACVGALPGVLGEDCTYNQSNPVNVPTWVGPVRGSNYYRGANSPFQKDPNAVPLPQPPFP
ncbi:MAG: hypothetical protein ACE5F8_07160, partial [Woeseiaceae bacterium]